MKLIIAGCRHFKLSLEELEEIIIHQNIPFSKITEVVSGGASGIDSLGEDWAESLTDWMPVKVFKPEYDKFVHKRAAPIARNIEMGKYADALLLIWDGQSKGSASMKAIMKKLNKPIYEVIIK